MEEYDLNKKYWHKNLYRKKNTGIVNYSYQRKTDQRGTRGMLSK